MKTLKTSPPKRRKIETEDEREKRLWRAAYARLMTSRKADESKLLKLFSKTPMSDRAKKAATKLIFKLYPNGVR